MSERRPRTGCFWAACLLSLGLFSGARAMVAQARVADAGDLIAQAQSRLGRSAGVIVLDQPSSLNGDVTLQEGQSLRVAAPLRVVRGTFHLAGSNTVSCEARISVDNATDLFVADGAHDLSIRDCDVTVTGHEGGTLLTATRSVRVHADNNQLVNMALFTTKNSGGPQNQTTDVSLNGNSSNFTRGIGPIGVYLMYVLHATVSNNRFVGTGHGIEWWGGDGNIGWHGADAVTLAGDLSITGNQCYSAGGACVWGSMGFNVTVSGNSADLCSDVCFDTEGGVRNLFTGNVAQRCGNGCYSVQMEGSDDVFSGNFAYADAKGPAAALVLIKHRNENPAPHANLTVTGNTLSCGTLCVAVYTEGESGLDLSHNTITNGYVVFANYTNSVRIIDNTLRFSALLDRAAISGPSLFNGHTSVIDGNTLMMDGATDPKSVCIAQSWSDDNNTDEMRITNNTCIGFSMGIVTETAGHNAGAPHAVWSLAGNRFSRIPQGQQLVHRKRSGNELYEANGS